MATQVTLNSGSVDSAGSLLLKTNGSTTAVTIDTSQNMGLGVTPSAWSAVKAMQIGTAAVYAPTSSQNTTLSANNYYDGSVFKYMTSDYASYYQQFSGQHRWYNAASGTAGNTITFTQAMTLDASGNLGVGQTSLNNSRLWVLGSNTQMILGYAGGSTNYIDCDTQIFRNFAGTEHMRIDSSGNLLVGTTSTSLSAGIGVKIQPAGYATTPTVSCVGSSSSNTADTYHVYSTGASAFRFYVGYGGTISATSTSITGLSDVSLKENIRDLETGLSEVLNLKPRRFDWKAETEINEKNVAGFIAQEVEEVLPELVYEYKYSAEETKKSLKMGDILPTLVKAIQELNAKVDAQAAEIAALKGQA